MKQKIIISLGLLFEQKNALYFKVISPFLTEIYFLDKNFQFLTHQPSKASMTSKTAPPSILKKCLICLINLYQASKLNQSCFSDECEIFNEHIVISQYFLSFNSRSYCTYYTFGSRVFNKKVKIQKLFIRIKLLGAKKRNSGIFFGLFHLKKRDSV